MSGGVYGHRSIGHSGVGMIRGRRGGPFGGTGISHTSTGRSLPISDGQRIHPSTPATRPRMRGSARRQIGPRTTSGGAGYSTGACVGNGPTNACVGTFPPGCGGPGGGVGGIGRGHAFGSFVKLGAGRRGTLRGAGAGAGAGCGDFGGGVAWRGAFGGVNVGGRATLAIAISSRASCRARCVLSNRPSGPIQPPRPAGR